MFVAIFRLWRRWEGLFRLFRLLLRLLFSLSALHHVNLLWFRLRILLFRLWLLRRVLVVLHVVLCLVLCVLLLFPVLSHRLCLCLPFSLLPLLLSSLILKSVNLLLDFDCELWGERGWGLLRLNAVVNEKALYGAVLARSEVLAIEVGCLSSDLCASGSVGVWCYSS